MLSFKFSRDGGECCEANAGWSGSGGASAGRNGARHIGHKSRAGAF